MYLSTSAAFAKSPRVHVACEMYRGLLPVTLEVTSETGKFQIVNRIDRTRLAEVERAALRGVVLSKHAPLQASIALMIIREAAQAVATQRDGRRELLNTFPNPAIKLTIGSGAKAVSAVVPRSDRFVTIYSLLLELVDESFVDDIQEKVVQQMEGVR